MRVGQILLSAGALLVFASGLVVAAPTLLNVSYDVTREFYRDYNAAFTAYWRQSGHGDVEIHQSHGGSSKQVRFVIDGLGGDVVTMNQALDINQLAEAGLVASDWAGRLPHGSVPYTSTILFVVRRANPKGIKDWPDLIRGDVVVIIPNPKTSGSGRYSYFAAWGYARRQPGGSDAVAQEFVRKLFAQIPVLDTGSRGATTNFARREIGDVLLTFENEVTLIRREFGAEEFEVVVPSISIRADNPVAWIDKTVAKRGTGELAKAYLEYLYSEEGQELAAKHNFRPQDPAVFARHAGKFPTLTLFSVEDVFGSWEDAQRVHFAAGGVFDQIHTKK